jgi:aminoglycoside phosphotransferase (APT) family kinase protein
MTITATQQALLDRWLPGAEIVKDHSWGVVQTTVLEVRHDGRRLIVKAGGPADHHLAREIRAHREWLTPWTSRGRAPLLRHADVEAKLLVTTYLPGELLLNSPSITDPDAFRQAGELLVRLHQQQATVDGTFERRENDKCLRLLAGPHRIPDTTADRLRTLITAWPTPPTTVVPTHGDWQPRNWLIHEGVVSIIDFGRAAMRPAFTDFSRLAAQDFRTGPDLEQAFLQGYGSEPRDPGGWARGRLREAIGTACWAHTVGDEPFEAQGLRMITEALPAFR